MFSNWQQEKATQSLIDDAQAVADRLATAKPHVIGSYAAQALFWAASYFANGQTLHELCDWTPAQIRRFTTEAEKKIAVLRKKRAYDSSDGLSVWLHTARAVTEPRVAPAVRDIWRQLAQADLDADTMAHELLADAGLPVTFARAVPKGFQPQD